MKFVVIIAMLCCTSAAHANDTLRFTILLFGDSVGKSTVTKNTRADGSVLYTLESISRAKILWIVRENYTKYEVVYRNGKLFSSRFIEKEKGKTVRWTNVTTDGKTYFVDSYKGKRTFAEAPTYSVATLYFHEVKEPRKMFFESEADFCQIVKTEDPASWEFKTSDGGRNIYHYKNGYPESMDVHVSIATIRIVRQH